MLLFVVFFSSYAYFSPDHDAILDAFNNKDLSRPNAIIAKTIKGKGISFMENDVLWHHGVLSQVQFEKAIEELKL